MTSPPPGWHPLLVLTDRAQATSGLVPTVAAAVDGGARVVVLREKDLPRSERLRLALAIAGLLEPVQGTLVLAGADVALARQVGAGAMHLSASDPFPPETGAGLVVGRSCHSAAEVSGAHAEGAHYTLISPVFPSASKPGYGPAVGIEGLTTAVASSSNPVFALGGVTAASVPACLEAGAAGVAVMGAVMAAADPTRITASLVSAVERRAGSR